MAYSPTTWQSGDVVSRQKLNKLEQGVSAAAAVADDALTQPEVDARVTAVGNQAYAPITEPQSRIDGDAQTLNTATGRAVAFSIALGG